MSPERGRRVYSSGPQGSVSERGRPCSSCRSTPCACEPTESLPPAGQAPRVRRERSGRRGRTVTVAAPLVLRREDAERLVTEFKRRCGAGGALRLERDRVGRPCFAIEVQGDQVERVVGWLEGLGYRAAREGG